MPMSKKPRTLPLIERRLVDDNFAHTVALMGMCAAWAEQVTENQRVSFNDRNLIHLPVEIALAFMREHLSDQSKLGEACRSAFQHLGEFRKQVNPGPDLLASQPPEHPANPVSLACQSSPDI